MVVVKHFELSNSKMRSRELQVNEATGISVENGALLLSRELVTVRVFASGQWQTAYVVSEEEVVS